MRKPRDFDSELRALTDKAKLLKERKLHQLGELVVSTGADALPVEQLAGALLTAIDTNDNTTRETWRKRGAVFFQRASRVAANADAHGAGGAAQNDGSATPDRG